MKNLFKKAVILVTALCFALPLVSCGDSEKSGKIKVYMPTEHRRSRLRL